MDKPAEEWFTQADYDLDTAEYMFRGGRHQYAVFMAHLAVEKALKGLYTAKLMKTPPKIHNLAYLLDRIGLASSQATREFLVKLNEAQIAARYPDTLVQMQAAYPEPVVQTILSQAKEMISWIKKQR